ncbi:hypothetical protein [Bdellovibrio svalbardensis]|uniref:Uncharacterized protein n=1 Tax=Bdellovibrio svalbardensis TaxID=2972972 RepID=A0ABT6DH07_9BACT|nr:hypothetical protein [Bdellovibrio svalbardensis]MDG0815784.1 hypothetical protein [Bdellovibrio svalbardensis]
MKVMNLFGMFLVFLTLTGCSLDASLVDIKAAYDTFVAPHRTDADYQNTEVSVSGNFVVSGQIGETAEKQTSGTYVVEGVIAYE